MQGVYDTNNRGRSKIMDDSILKAFVIMAFDREFDAIYSDLIKPSLENAGYEVTRADSLVDQQNILKGIIRQIAKADLVIVELTALNANVFYELGIAHALRKRTILITQSVEELPFDLRSYRVVPYSTRFDEIRNLMEALTGIAEKAKDNSIDFSNPVIDFLPGNDNHKQVPEENSAVVTSREQINVEPDEEKGLWDFVVEEEDSFSRANETLTHLTEAIREIGNRMATRTEEANQIKNSGAAGTAAKMYRLVELSAAEITVFAEKVEAELPEFRLAWEDVSQSIKGLLRVSQLRTTEDREAVTRAKDVFIVLSTSITASLDSLKTLRDTQSQMRGISRSMNRATRRSSSALDQAVAEFEKILSYTVKIVDLLDELLLSGQTPETT
jgi:uncharacterized protein YkvS